VPPDLDGEISRIVFSAVIETEEYDFSSICIYVISGGVEIYRSSHLLWALGLCMDAFLCSRTL
jgi:hypothetical protein